MFLILSCLLLQKALSSPSDPRQTDTGVITSSYFHEILSDVRKLTDGETYRVYAVHARSVKSEEYPSSVIIKGANNASFTVAELANRAFIRDKSPFLDYSIITAPVTIDAPFLAEDKRIAFTVYFVSTKRSLAPVVSAQHFEGHINTSLANISSPFCTIMSAEKSFELSDIRLTEMHRIDITVLGYDATAEPVLSVNESTTGSVVAINGPIATLQSAGREFVNFQFALNVSNENDDSLPEYLPPGASTAFLSAGWLTRREQYYSDYLKPLYLPSRSYDFGRDTNVTFLSEVANFIKGNSAHLTCKRSDGSFDSLDLSEIPREVETICERIAIRVVAPMRCPRFLVKVFSRKSIQLDNEDESKEVAEEEEEETSSSEGDSQNIQKENSSLAHTFFMLIVCIILSL